MSSINLTDEYDRATPITSGHITVTVNIGAGSPVSVDSLARIIGSVIPLNDHIEADITAESVVVVKATTSPF